MRAVARNGAFRGQLGASCLRRHLSTTSHLWRAPLPKTQPVKQKTTANKGSLAAALSKLHSSKPAPHSRVDSVSHGHDPNTRLRLDFGKYSGRHKLFRSTVLHRFQIVLNKLGAARVGVTFSEDELSRHSAVFMDAIDHAFSLAEKGITRRDKNPLFWNLRDAFVSGDIKGLTKEVHYSFQSFIFGQRFPKNIEDSHKRLLDFRFPYEWFPATRTMQRTIHVHVGPTNSGKTYNALKALESSKCGVYAGPLRLLATEVYQRFKAKNIPCALITGEEVRIPENTDQYFSSCTVEMIPLNTRFDVAVIDEIQMIADADRGNAWTAAVLGVQAKEVHVCGEERAVKVIQQMCASVGDKCVVHRYERLSPLKTMDKPLDNDYNLLQKGDAIVAFSRVNLHSLKTSIERKTGRRCAIIYGSLPPEVRAQQAALFNDPDNDYDFVVASDAIGMGLNLEIRRVIMESVTKFDGSQNRLLTFPEIKQIGGRAGRYRSAQNPDGSTDESEKVGLVTTMERADLRSVQRAFQRTVEDIQAACIQPPAGIVERFASYFPTDTPLSYILKKIQETATVSSLYKMGLGSDILEIADIIQDIPLTIHDRLTFCYLPVALRADRAVDVLRALAQVVATNSKGDLLDIEEIPLEFLDINPEDFSGSGQQYLSKLEALHVALNQYVWLSYRYSGMFRSQALAFHVRTLVEEKLMKTLEWLNYSDEQLERKRESKRQQVKTRNANRSAIGEGHVEGVEQHPDDDLVIDELPERTKQEVPAV